MSKWFALMVFIFGCASGGGGSMISTTVNSIGSNEINFPAKLNWQQKSDDMFTKNDALVCAENFVTPGSVEQYRKEKDCGKNCIRVQVEIKNGNTKSDTWTNTYTKNTYTDVTYERNVELKFYKGKNLIHQIRGVSWGPTNDVRKVLPSICRALGKDFPETISGKVYKFRLQVGARDSADKSGLLQIQALTCMLAM